jgi:benzoyl-CoA reductase/2-hydroxyglutaryl-CoA dehydratase subunit BcrC/BadD/HgdB
MNPAPRGRIGYTCAYTPLALIDAAGFAPHRVLPLGEAPARAGELLHDNLCPHVKRVLDRALAGDLPELAGLVVVNSCDAMRRLADAWRRVRPGEPVALLDLPATRDAAAVAFFTGELARLAETLAAWGGIPTAALDLDAAAGRFNRLAELLGVLDRRSREGRLAGGRAALQALYNQASTLAPAEAIPLLAARVAAAPAPAPDGVPLYLFGNVLADPEAFALLEACGARVAGDDLCTGARLFHPMPPAAGADGFERLAQAIQGRPPCARTFDPRQPGALAADLVAAARACGARGVVGHTLKFCDPYLARLPLVREALQAAGLPLLLLEGDCTLRALEQQRTRLEAFTEMLR